MKKIFALMTAAALSFALAACGSGQTKPEADQTLISQPESTSSVSKIPVGVSEIPIGVSDKVNKAGLTSGKLNPATFPGKIRDGFYASGNRLLVLSDQLYLYDTEQDTILSSTTVTQEQLTVKAFDKGYLAVGFENGTLIGILYDAVLQETQHIVFADLMADDYIENAATISKDGKQVAFAGIRGLYLYDVEQQAASVLMKFEDGTGINGSQVGLMNYLAFSEDGSIIIYAGLGHSVPIIDGEEGFSIYGYIATDGSSQQMTKKDSYEVESLSVYGNTLIMPQTFISSDGTLLMADVSTKAEKVLRFDSNQEGKNGVFCSSQGNYVATTTLGSGMTIRIYDTNTGDLLCTETIQDNGEEYFYRIPKVMILDGSRTCIVLMGHTMNDIETVTYVFEF